MVYLNSAGEYNAQSLYIYISRKIPWVFKRSVGKITLIYFIENCLNLDENVRKEEKMTVRGGTMWISLLHTEHETPLKVSRKPTEHWLTFVLENETPKIWLKTTKFTFHARIRCCQKPYFRNMWRKGKKLHAHTFSFLHTIPSMLQ